jgi:hypothetical protein
VTAGGRRAAAARPGCRSRGAEVVAGLLAEQLAGRGQDRGARFGEDHLRFAQSRLRVVDALVPAAELVAGLAAGDRLGILDPLPDQPQLLVKPGELGAPGQPSCSGC